MTSTKQHKIPGPPHEQFVLDERGFMFVTFNGSDVVIENVIGPQTIILDPHAFGRLKEWIKKNAERVY